MRWPGEAQPKASRDLSFYDDLEDPVRGPGDFAQAYVLAHEIGHHVQHLLRVTDQVRESQRARPEGAAALSVRLELQADCLAGIWARSTHERQLLEEGTSRRLSGPLPRWATTASRSRPEAASRPRPGRTARRGSAWAGSGAASRRAGWRTATRSAPRCRGSRAERRGPPAERLGPPRAVW